MSDVLVVPSIHTANSTCSSIIDVRAVAERLAGRANAPTPLNFGPKVN